MASGSDSHADERLFDFDSLPDELPQASSRVAQCHFFTFGNGRFEGAARQLAAEVEALGGLFQEVHCFTELPADIAADRRWADHLSRGRSHGYGWWFWKPALVNYLLRQGTVQDGDTLVYCDAGCVVGARSHHNWMMLLRRVMPEEHDSTSVDFVAFHHQHLENRYTKGDTFAHFGTSWDDEDFGLTCQLVGGYWLARISPRTRRLFELWEMLAEDVSLISDDPPKLPNPHFLENRHDQSIYSMLMKNSGLAFERQGDSHFNAAACASDGTPSSFKARVGQHHVEFGISGLQAVVLNDVGWPVTGDPRQPIAAARRRCEGSSSTAAIDPMEGCY